MKMEDEELTEREMRFLDGFTRVPPEIQKIIIACVMGDEDEREAAMELLRQKEAEELERRRRLQGSED